MQPNIPHSSYAVPDSEDSPNAIPNPHGSVSILLHQLPSVQFNRETPVPLFGLSVQDQALSPPRPPLSKPIRFCPAGRRRRHQDDRFRLRFAPTQYRGVAERMERASREPQDRSFVACCQAELERSGFLSLGLHRLHYFCCVHEPCRRRCSDIMCHGKSCNISFQTGGYSTGGATKHDGCY